jgi:hypothetical protein
MQHNQRRIVHIINYLPLLFGLALILTSCGGGEGAPTAALETFLQALADKNEAQYVTLTCGEYELDALLEYNAFSMVNTHIENLDCQTVSVNGDTAEIICQGEIIANYGNEIRTFELSERNYQVVKRDGQWLVCGYQDPQPDSD